MMDNGNVLAEMIHSHEYIRISEEDADRVAEWAIDMNGRGWSGGPNLLLIGRTGSGKSVLIQKLWPFFKAPANGFVGPWKKLHTAGGEPMIIDETNLGLSGVKPKMAREMVAGLNACNGALLVTSFSDLEGLTGDWIRVTLDKKKNWEME